MKTRQFHWTPDWRDEAPYRSFTSHIPTAKEYPVFFKKRPYFQEYIRYSHIYKRAATKIKGTATEYCPSQDNTSAGHSKSKLHCKASGTRKSLDDKVVNTVRQSNTFNSTIFSLWHYRFDFCQTIQITKCIPPIALAEGRVAETSLGKILALPRRGGSESELLTRQGTSFQYQKSHLDLVVWYWQGTSLFVSSSDSIQIVRRHCCLLLEESKIQSTLAASLTRPTTFR